MTNPLTWTQRRQPDAITVAVHGLGGFFFIGILAALILWLMQAWPALSQIGPAQVIEKEWFYRTHTFGAAAMIYGSLAVSIVALLLAAPIAFAAAIFVSEYLPRAMRPVAKMAMEFLATIPSVVYGLLGILFLRNWMAEGLAAFDPISGDMILTAAVLLAAMILPTITTFAEDALRAVPAAQRLAGRALALNQSEVIQKIVLPQALPGMIAAALLGIGRALGETIAVFLVIGRLDNQMPGGLFDFSRLLQPGQTLTSKLGGPETHIAMGDPLHWGAMLSLGLILLVLSMIFLGSGVFLRRIQSQSA